MTFGEEIRIMQGVSEILAERCKRMLPDGREATLLVQVYNVKVIVGEPGATTYENGW